MKLSVEIRSTRQIKRGAAMNENACLQDQRLSTLLDCSSLNWSSSGMPIRLFVAQISTAV